MLIAVTLAACSTTDKTSTWLEPDLQLVPAVEFSDTNEKPTLSERMARYGVPAVSIALIEANDITLEAYGLSDTESAQDISTTMQLQAASISKPVTAVAVMALADAGLVDLDAPVNDYLATWKLPDTDFNRDDPVTIRELLSHSGGISVPSYPGFERGADMPTVDDILTGAPNAYSDPVTSIAEQGTYRYSGGGYMVLQKIIEDVSGKSFETFMQETLFAPSGMTSSTFNIQSEPDGLAFGHNWNGKRRVDPWQDYPQAAPAGLWSTPGDLARWLVSYGKAYQGDRAQVITTESARAMAEEIVDNTGLGFGVHGAGDALHVSHAGWTIGYRSYVFYFPESGDGIVIMTNSDAGHYLIDDMLRTLGRAKGWPGFGQSVNATRVHWSEEKMDAMAGSYRMMPARFVVTFNRKGNSFELSTPRGSSYTAVPTGPSSLILEETGDIITRDSETGVLQFWGMTATPEPDSDENKNTGGYL
jgi:CubicO group peptidase (beta-lactamase class C family)